MALGLFRLIVEYLDDPLLVSFVGLGREVEVEEGSLKALQCTMVG